MQVTSTPGFSIVMCCYNSAERLPATLKHIASLHIPAGLPCELLVVNNASNDHTVQVISAEWGKYVTPVILRVLDEPVLGLSNARKTGFENALYDYVIWCDDDNWLNNNYLDTVVRIFENSHNAGIIGGCGEYTATPGIPEWLNYSKHFFAIGPQAAYPGPVKGNRVYGAGAVIFKPAYQKLRSAGFQQLLTDRLGTNLASGGDYELCDALTLAGYTVCYDEGLKFTHHLPEIRLTKPYYLKLLKESVPCLTTLDAYSIVLNGKSGYVTLDYVAHVLRDLTYFGKEMFIFFFKELITDKHSDYGFYIRTRTAFFKARFSNILFNLLPIYSNAKKLHKLKKNLKGPEEFTEPASVFDPSMSL